MASTFFGSTFAELQDRGAAWTAREILQQPELWSQVASLVAEQGASLDAWLAPLLANPSLRVILTGAGSSALIGRCLAPAAARHLNRRVDAVATTDVVSGPSLRLQRDVPTLLISFARSGSSPESVATVDIAERLLAEVHHLIITCNREGALVRQAARLRSARTLVLPDASNDRGFAMTSSFTCMLLSAGLLLGVTRKAMVPALCDAAERLLPRIDTLAKRLAAREFQRVVYLGSNELSALASEAALKMLELTDGQIVTLADSPLGFRHGPKTIVNARTLVVVLLSNDAHTCAYDLDLLNELRADARAGEILALSACADGVHETGSLLLDGVGAAFDVELAPVYALFAQSYGLLQSLALGLTPDRPNVAGVVNRVVQGVTIHPFGE